MSIAWALFIPSCFALNMAPGPNNLLSVNNAARFGFAASGSILMKRPLPLGENYACDTEGVVDTVAALRERTSEGQT